MEIILCLIAMVCGFLAGRASVKPATGKDYADFVKSYESARQANIEAFYASQK